MKKIKIVTLGAGTGQAILLAALRQFQQFDLTAIVGVSDNGGHSGVLRRQFGIPQVGDSRQCLVALSPSSRYRDEYEYRDSEGCSRGNELLAQATVEHGKLSKAIELAGQRLGVVGRVLPVTDAAVDIAARLVDGTTVVGEWEIIDRHPCTPIVEMLLQPSAEALPAAILAVQAADYIVVGPGSLRTGIVSCLLAQGMSQAVRNSQTVVILVVNLMTHPGQTDGFTVQDHMDEFAHYAGRYPDYAIINNDPIPSLLVEHYATFGSIPVVGLATVPTVQVVIGGFVPETNNFRARQERVGEFKKWTHALVHDGNKLARCIALLVGVDEEVTAVAGHR